MGKIFICINSLIYIHYHVGEELHIELDEISTEDVYSALKHTKPSALTMKDRYIQWQNKYESV